jgi:hypothetical protein
LLSFHWSVGFCATAASGFPCLREVKSDEIDEAYDEKVVIPSKSIVSKMGFPEFFIFGVYLDAYTTE